MRSGNAAVGAWRQQVAGPKSRAGRSLPSEVCDHKVMHLRGTLLCAVGVLAATAVFYAADAPKLPPPFDTPSSANFPRLVDKPADGQLQLPPGFTAGTPLTLTQPRRTRSAARERVAANPLSTNN